MKLLRSQLLLRTLYEPFSNSSTHRYEYLEIPTKLTFHLSVLVLGCQGLSDVPSLVVLYILLQLSFLLSARFLSWTFIWFGHCTLLHFFALQKHLHCEFSRTGPKLQLCLTVLKSYCCFQWSSQPSAASELTNVLFLYLNKQLIWQHLMFILSFR